MASHFLPSLFTRDERNDPFRSLQRQIDQLFSDFSRDSFFSGNGQDMMSRIKVDVAETDKAIEIMADLPGVDEKDIDVNLVDNVLTIKAQKKNERDEKGKNFRVVERSYGAFERSMTLPFKADAKQVEAKFDKGVLKLVLQKPPEVQAGSQKIAISSGRS
jgi:HSP20 family protein